MGILSENLVDEVFPKFQEVFEVKTKYTAGGICPHEVQDRIGRLRGPGGDNLGLWWPMIYPEIVAICREYMKRWHYDPDDPDMKPSIEYFPSLWNKSHTITAMIDGTCWIRVLVSDPIRC